MLMIPRWSSLARHASFSHLFSSTCVAELRLTGDDLFSQESQYGEDDGEKTTCGGHNECPGSGASAMPS